MVIMLIVGGAWLVAAATVGLVVGRGFRRAGLATDDPMVDPVPAPLPVAAPPLDPPALAS